MPLIAVAAVSFVSGFWVSDGFGEASRFVKYGLLAGGGYLLFKAINK